MKVRWVIAASMLALRVPPLAAAEPPPAMTVTQDPAFEQLLGILEGSEEQQAFAIDRSIDAVIKQLGDSVPLIGEAMKANPGMAPELKGALRPAFTAYAKDGRDLIHRDMLAVMSSELSLQDVRALAAFYGSPLGQRLTDSAAANYNPTNVVRDAMTEGEVKSSSVKADTYKAGLAGLKGLSAADQKAVIGFAMSPVGARFNALLPKLVEIRARSENLPMSPELNEAMSKAMLPVLEKYLGSASGD